MKKKQKTFILKHNHKVNIRHQLTVKLYRNKMIQQRKKMIRNTNTNTNSISTNMNNKKKLTKMIVYKKKSTKIALSQYKNIIILN